MAALTHVPPPRFDSILIANRGEIARRIIRTCRRMGITAIAIYNDVDRHAPHVREADRAIHLAGTDLTTTYLDMDAILNAARKAGAGAIHPGYGFLSENAEFARACSMAGIVFIGPHPEAIEQMGSKQHAKQLLEAHGIPMIPGYHGDEQDTDVLAGQAEKIGYPVMVKAAAGGGGKGMRIADNTSGLKSALETVKREAKAAFGDDRVILEKYIERARHIEVQIFGDSHGNLAHLFERECSLQRRYQKIIEETPSPVLDEETRQRLCATALRIGQLLTYDNAGTVEFVYDETIKEFYFLEVNTRLQVEHPVTELTTGIDLVQWQIEVAAGGAIPIEQEEITRSGYAVEARLYAEDPPNNFLPDTGTILRLDLPEVSAVRYDLAIETGSEVSVYFDPMIGKVIACGTDRRDGLRRLRYVLDHLVCLGVRTNQTFLSDLVRHPDVTGGRMHTTLVDQLLPSLTTPTDTGERNFALISACLIDWKEREGKRTLLRHLPSGWRNNYYEPQQSIYRMDGEQVTVYYRRVDDSFEISIDDREYTISHITFNPGILSFETGGERIAVQFVCEKDTTWMYSTHFRTQVVEHVDRFARQQSWDAQSDYTAPMPSQVVDVLVKSGETVLRGQPLLVLSSMKMENTLTAGHDGTVESVLVKAGDQVDKGAELVRILPANQNETKES